MQNSVLVTGGAGYIGSHVCLELARSGYTPVTYDNLSRGFKSAVKWGPFVEGELIDRARLVQTIRTFKIKSVIHLAAFASVSESVFYPALYYQNNIIGSFFLLQAMRDAGVERIVFSSSCATYGTAEYLPIDEKHAQKPISPYGVSKLTVEKMLLDYERAYGLSSISLRYFNAAGADAEGEAGERYEPGMHLIPLAIRAALGVGPRLTIYGTDFDTADGTCVRDYVHVSDLARAHVLALEELERAKRSSAYNLGVERGCSIQEILQSVKRVCGREVPVVFRERRAGDPSALIADSQKARNELAWLPRYSDIDQIISTTHSFFLRLSTKQTENESGKCGPKLSQPPRPLTANPSPLYR